MFRRFVSLTLLVLALGQGGGVSAGAALVVGPLGRAPVRRFTMQQLQALPQVDLRTANDFVDGVRDFRGPLARAVLDLGGGRAAHRVVMTAANDYQVEFDAAELRKYNAIIALSMDGKPLSKRGKGPLWLIYPMSQHAELRDPAYNSRLIWQLVRIEYK